MEIKREFWFPGSETEEARTIYVTGGEGVTKEVVERFVQEWEEDPSQIMDMDVNARARTITSSYNRSPYNVRRPKLFSLHIEEGRAS